MKRMTVSLCMIARDEEATIGMAIKSVLALVDEVIVVDTGSRDNTRIIAEGYGARVLDVPWSDDFSAARNVALDEATCDWILILDADEILQAVRPVEFQRLLHEPGVAAYRLQLETGGDDGYETAGLLRLYRNAPQIRYCYPIHEQIGPALDSWALPQAMTIRDSELIVVHDGCRPERSSRKRERTQRILRKAMLAHPEEPYFSYQLACAGLSLLDEEVLPVAGLESSLTHLNAAWNRVRILDPHQARERGWLPDLGAKVTSALLGLGRIDEARRVVDQVRRLFADHPLILLHSVAADVHYLQHKAGDLDDEIINGVGRRIESDLDRLDRVVPIANAIALDSRVRDLYPLRYRGELALLRGQVSDAVGCFEQALSRDPGYSFGWLGMAECSRFAGDRKRALKLYLRTVTENERNHRAWLRGCDLMREMEFHDNAASWWRKVVVLFPEHPAVGAHARAADDQTARPLTTS